MAAATLPAVPDAGAVVGVASRSRTVLQSSQAVAAAGVPAVAWNRVAVGAIRFRKLARSLAQAGTAARPAAAEPFAQEEKAR